MCRTCSRKWKSLRSDGVIRIHTIQVGMAYMKENAACC